MGRVATASEVVTRRAIGQRLKWWRTARGHSQYTLAQAVGVSQPALSNYEAGRRDIPLTLATAIASELQVSVGDFAGVPLPEPVALHDPRMRQMLEVLVNLPELVEAVSRAQPRG